MREDLLFSGTPELTSMAYAVSKMAGMQLCLAYNQQHGRNRFIPLIPNSVYRPNDNFDPEKAHVLSALIRRFHHAALTRADEVELWGSDAPSREFIHADDLIDACAFLLETDTSGLQLPINVGSGHDLTIKELAELVAAVAGYSGAIKWDIQKPDAAPKKPLDSLRIHATGWRARANCRMG